MGRVVSIGAANASINLAAQVVYGIVYEPFGPPSSLAYGNGVFEARSYDLDYRETGRFSSFNSQLQYLNYGYDANDNVLSIIDTVTPANTQALGYDVMNRLVSATGSYGTLQYAYDLVGNRQSQTVAGTVQNYTYTTGSNRLAAITQGGTTLHQFAYSPTGNVTQDNRAGTVFNFAYLQADRLRTVQQGSTPVATYFYDAFGQRLVKGLPGSPASYTFYQYDLAGHLIEDSNISTGTPSFLADYIYLGDQPVGLVLPGAGLLYYHDDRLGTPQLATANQSVIDWTGIYQPFGTVAITGSIAQNLRLPGQYADAETGWSNNGFRTYAPDLGRYIQADPIGLEGGVNTYSYGGGNPIRSVDRSGTFLWPPGFSPDEFLCLLLGLCGPPSAPAPVTPNACPAPLGPLPPCPPGAMCAIPNNGRTPQHGNPDHDSAIRSAERAARDEGAENIRVNQQQVDVNGTPVSSMRPDLQYDLGGTHYNYEVTRSWDTLSSKLNLLRAADPASIGGGGVLQ
jgi:RHS repeat-associated protein